jgi:hypothetical protein
MREIMSGSKPYNPACERRVPDPMRPRHTPLPELMLGGAPAPREAALSPVSAAFWREPALAADFIGEATPPSVPAGLMSLNICWQATGLPVPLSR